MRYAAQLKVCSRLSRNERPRCKLRLMSCAVAWRHWKAVAFKIEFAEALRRGIRLEDFAARNTQALKSCRNMRVSEYGLKQFYPLTEPVDLTDLAGDSSVPNIPKAWPFPQLFRSAYPNRSYLMTETGIYLVDESTWLGSALSLGDLDSLPTVNPFTIPSGGLDWQFLDFQNNSVMLNGDSVIIAAQFGSNSVTITSGCTHKRGRVLFGGFADDVDAVADFDTWFDSYKSDAPSMLASGSTGFDTGEGGNWVWWSSIGAVDMYRFFIRSAILEGSLETALGLPLTSGYDATDDPYWLDLVKRNEAGFAPMPFSGTITVMKELGDFVVVYGTDGVCCMRHVTPANVSTYGVLPIEGLDVRVGAHVSANCRNVAAGDHSTQVFVDNQKQLWVITQSGGGVSGERRGYSSEIGSLGDDLVVTYEPEYREFYISDGVDALLFNRHGLSKAPWCPTQISMYAGGSVSIFLDASETSAVEVVTEKFTSDDGTVKCLRSIKVDGLNDASNRIQYQVEYRLKNTDDFTATAAANLDERGMAYPAVPGFEWRIKLTAPNRETISVENITVQIDEGNPSTRHWLDASTPAAATE